MSERIRVLFTIGSLSGGGSERQVVGILKHLDRSRFEPLLYLVYRTGELLPDVPDDVPIVSFEERRGLPRLYFPGHIHRLCVSDLAQAVRELKVDVVYDRTLHMTLIAAGATRRTNTRRVSAIVSDPARDFAQTVTRFRFLKYRILQRAYRSADRVVTVSEGVRTGAADYYGIRPDLISVVPNIIDSHRLERLQEVDRTDERDSPADEFRVLFVGRLSEEKGIQQLVESVRRVVTMTPEAPIRLQILGTGPLDERLRNFVREHRLETHISFEGFQSDVSAYLARTHLYCLPSLHEGMPNALIEAMACGVPVLATDCPHGPRELLCGGRLGRLIPPDDPQRLAEALVDAMTHYADWQQPVAAAREHVIQRHSPTSGIAILQDVLVAAAKRSV